MSPASQASLPKLNPHMPFALPPEEVKARMVAIIERVVDGENLPDIAAEIGVTRHRIYQLMAEHAEEAWKSAQIARALMNLDNAELQLEGAATMVEVAACTARVKSAQWQLERLHRRLFAQEQAAAAQAVQINISIEREPNNMSNAVTVTGSS